MSHTPQQAATLWCPMVRLTVCTEAGNVTNGQTVMNRLQKGRATVVPDSSRCLADACAMWRWVVKTQVVSHVPDGKLFAESQVAALPLTHGYCGLAGKPEGGAQ